jgi:hypothetical protein
MDGKSHLPFAIATVPLALLCWVVFWAQNDFSWAGAIVIFTDDNYNWTIFLLSLFWLVVDFVFANRTTRLYRAVDGIAALVLVYAAVMLLNHLGGSPMADESATVTRIDLFSTPGRERQSNTSLLTLSANHRTWYFKVSGGNFREGGPATLKRSSGLLFPYLADVYP